MEIDPEKIDEIINAHAETVNALKAERDIALRESETYKADSQKLAEAQEKLSALESAGRGQNVYEERYNKLKEERDALQGEFDRYKADVEASERKRVVTDAYKALLRDAKISEKHIDKILKVSDLDSLELGEDGKFKNEEEIKKSIEGEWGEFAVKERVEGAGVPTPMKNGAGVPRGGSRAAKLAAQYHNNIYGKAKED